VRAKSSQRDCEETEYGCDSKKCHRHLVTMSLETNPRNLKFRYLWSR
jgi:hypothetical protein